MDNESTTDTMPIEASFPKFSKGDLVSHKTARLTKHIVCGRSYDPDNNRWWYWLEHETIDGKPSGYIAEEANLEIYTK